MHEKTKDLINKVSETSDTALADFVQDTIKHMKKGSWLVNTARGAICNTEAVKEALESGHILGYGGDVWPVQVRLPACSASCSCS